MKRFAAITLLCILFGSAFVAGKSPAGTPVPPWADSLRSLYLYTEGIKANSIAGDSARARRLFTEAIRADSTFAPAWFELATNGLYNTPDEAVTLADAAYRLDTTNKWYMQFYGQTLIYADRYPEAREVYRKMVEREPSDPENYRLLAALYEETKNPFMALTTLDSAEMRFGRIPVLSAMKRRLLIATRQTDKAIEEARALVDAAPYDAQNHVALADLYARTNKDSLAQAEYGLAMQIDSTDVQTLLSLADYYDGRHDYRALLSVTKRIFEAREVPLEMKVRQFEQITSDRRFYREYYLQINDLASTLAVRYPNDKRIVELYANHLIASGELEQALVLYKQHLDDQPPVEEYYRMVIDIEGYQKHADSVAFYVAKAVALFPDKPDFRISEGHVLVVAGQYEQGIKVYQDALRYAATDSLRSAIWGLIGDTWHQKAVGGEQDNDEQFAASSGSGAFRTAMKKCYKAYDKSLSFDPDNAMVLNNYAYFLSIGGGNLEKALSMSSRALALSENNPTYMDTHAWVLFGLGRAAEAKRVMQQAIALDSSNSPELMVHYGDILYALGEKFTAEIYWRRALEHGYDADAIARRLERNKTAK